MGGLDGRTVLLFYREYDHDRVFKGDRHVRRVLRPLYNAIRRDQSTSGFAVWTQTLAASLVRIGCRVEVNNYALARRNPDHPIGLTGYPAVLRKHDLPNPAILGPGMYDHPALRPDLMRDPRFRLYIVTCDWVMDMFRPVYGASCVSWFGGIDTERWSDRGSADKRFDVLVYDKVRWRRDHLVPGLIQPILDELRRRELSYRIVRYGEYSHRTYERLLGEARTMLFLCEHETQGLAYQEAMACNLPVLAWDPGEWVDPRRPALDPNPIPACSVPYFSAACGERFTGIEEFSAALDRFWANRTRYEPRRFVQTRLSLEASAHVYLGHYTSLLAAERGLLHEPVSA